MQGKAEVSECSQEDPVPSSSGFHVGTSRVSSLDRSGLSDRAQGSQRSQVSGSVSGFSQSVVSQGAGVSQGLLGAQASQASQVSQGLRGSQGSQLSQGSLDSQQRRGSVFSKVSQGSRLSVGSDPGVSGIRCLLRIIMKLKR